MKLLEVIVNSVDDALEAAAGGADRLELVRDLPAGGLTPDRGLVEDVLAAVRVPVRVMLRETPDMLAGDEASLTRLADDASFFNALPIDGLVAGFVHAGAIDWCAVEVLLAAAPQKAFTFHRAFDELAHHAAALGELLRYPAIDHVLTVGGQGSWPDRERRLHAWQHTAGTRVTVLVGAGLSSETLTSIARSPSLREAHVGRAARIGHSAAGPVRSHLVSAVKTALS